MTMGIDRHIYRSGVYEVRRGLDANGRDSRTQMYQRFLELGEDQGSIFHRRQNARYERSYGRAEMQLSCALKNRQQGRRALETN